MDQVGMNDETGDPDRYNLEYKDYLVRILAD